MLILLTTDQAEKGFAHSRVLQVSQLRLLWVSSGLPRRNRNETMPHTKK